MSTTFAAQLTGWLLLAMPLMLILAGLPAARAGVEAARRYRRRVQIVTMAALGAAVLAVLAYLFGSSAKLVLGGFMLPGDISLNALSVQVDRVTLALAALVAFVVALIARYSDQYLDGDPRQGHFFRMLSLTAGLFMLVVIADNIALFTVAIIATGFTLHQLLLFYRDRPKAVMAAHKKTLFSRTADGALLGATLLIGFQVGSFEFDALAAYATQHEGALPATLHLAAWLIVIGAVLKSAQFPFHGWLLQVMEAPTPVSALMHAGIVYSGAIIVLRSSDFLMIEGTALIALAVVGLATLIIASLVMLTQTAIKASLAWSTVGQLGFMLFELGMGLFALALLHLIGHSLYKAHAFLASGSSVDMLRQPAPKARRALGGATWLAVVVASVGVTAGLAWAMGLSVAHEPALLALVAIVALAVTQPVLKAATIAEGAGPVVRAALVSTSMAAVYFALHALFVTVFGLELAPMPQQIDPAYGLLIAAAIAGFLWLAWVQALGNRAMGDGGRRALYVHLYNGLYVDLLVERLSYRLWPHKVGRREGRRSDAAFEAVSATRQS
ncbi:MAG: proton-conducting transporter membrane subunit [Halothiobacillaceae bacterium]